MNCKDARSAINDILDRAEPRSVADAEAHCEHCPECRRWRAEMRLVQAALMIPAPEVEMDIAAAVKARLPERHPQSLTARPSRRMVFGWVTAAWVAGVVLLAALIAGAASLVAPGLQDRMVIWALDAVRAVWNSGAGLSVAAAVVLETALRTIGAIGLSAKSAGGIVLLLAAAETAAIVVVLFLRRRVSGATVFA